MRPINDRELADYHESSILLILYQRGPGEFSLLRY
jgi:hypothetical protein